ncbi:hypothetical protein [Campylobacter hominis]|jgi:hypothetical protein
MIKVDENGVVIDGNLSEVMLDLLNVIYALINQGVVDKEAMRKILNSDNFWNYTCKKEKK